MLARLVFIHFSLTPLKKFINHEHSCKILYAFFIVVCSKYFKKCYLLLNVSKEMEPIKRRTWDDMESSVCKKYGWSLISIHSKDENDFMGELLRQRYEVDNRQAYIGK